MYPTAFWHPQQASAAFEGRRHPVFVRNHHFHPSAATIYADGFVQTWEADDIDALEGAFTRESLRLVLAPPPGSRVHFPLDPIAFDVVANDIPPGWFAPRDWIAELRRSRDELRAADPGVEARIAEAIAAWRDDVRRRHPEMAHLHSLHRPRDPGRREGRGEGLWVLRRTEGRNDWTLEELAVFADGIDLAGERLQPADLRERLLGGELAVEVPDGTWIALPWEGAGRVWVAKFRCWLGPEDFAAAVADEMESLAGRPTSQDRCREAFEQHALDPSETNRLRLAETYLQVPIHRRMFLGDMDSKDADFLAAIHGPDRIAEERAKMYAHLRAKYPDDARPAAPPRHINPMSSAAPPRPPKPWWKLW